MKYLVLISILFVSACAMQQKVEDPSIKATANNMNQHISMAVTLAKFYCANDAWPTSIDSLKSFSSTVDLPLPAEVDWGWLKRDEVTYKVTSNVYLRTPDETNSGGGMSVSSINEPPICNGDDMKINVYPTIGG